MTDLAALKAENEAAWRRDIHLPDYDRKVVEATCHYLPALEGAVERLKSALRAAGVHPYTVEAIANGTVTYEPASFKVDL